MENGVFFIAEGTAPHPHALPHHHQCCRMEYVMVDLKGRTECNFLRVQKVGNRAHFTPPLADREDL